MKIGGMGHMAVRIKIEDLRRLNEIPEEVTIVACLPPWNGNKSGAWTPTAEPSPLFLYIRHRYCDRIQPGNVLSWQDLDHFLEHFKISRQQENDRAGQRVEDTNLPAFHLWVNDDHPDERP